MTDSSERRWPWYQQAVDAAAAALALGVAITFTYRGTWPIPGVAFIMVCLGKAGASTALRLLLARWADKP